MRRACTAARKALEPFRTKRNELLQLYLSNHYGSGATKTEQPLNLLALAAGIYSRALFARSPQVTVRTAQSAWKARGVNLELALNQLLPRILFKQEMNTVVLNSLFGCGLMKVGIAGEGDVEVEGETYTMGQPYAMSVDPDDWVHDTCARAWHELGFCGSRSRMPLGFAKEYEGFDKKTREELTPTHKGRPSYADGDQQDRAEWLGRSDYGGEEDEYEDLVEVWDFWLPHEKLVVTLPVRGGDTPLAVVEWKGPPEGPYHMLGLLDNPAGIMPISPLGDLKDLHVSENSLLRKLLRQATREKEIGLVPGGSKDDALRMTRSADGEFIRQDVPGAIQKMRLGGPDQATLMFSLQLKDLFSWKAGNLDTQGGLSPQAGTLGQEKLLAEATSAQTAEWQDRVGTFVKRVIRGLGYWLWTDPISETRLTKRFPGTDVEIETLWTPDQRQGEYENYEVDIEPYSMRDQSPVEKLRGLTEFIQNFALPMAPMMQASGVGLNIEAMFKTFAKLGRLPELLDMLTFQAAAEQQPMGGPQGPPSMPEPGKPPVTRRIEERISTPGSTRRGSDALMGQMLANMGGIQPAEARVA